MEAIIDKAVADGTKIDAILAENDSTALGVVGALTAKNYGFPPLSGQDGDPANLNNVALGKQYVDVLKNANELGKAAGAAALAAVRGSGQSPPSRSRTASSTRRRPGGRAHRLDFTTPGGDHGQVVHPPADPAHRGQPPGGGRRPARSPRKTCARVSTPRRRRPPASERSPTADLEFNLRPRGNPGAQVASSARTRRRAAVTNVADTAPVPVRPSPPRVLRSVV